jgi:GNAT superfamily N-acetyltransferase
MNKNDLFNYHSPLQQLQHIESCAFHTWPAVENVPQGDWIMRASGGITKRANSVWTAAGSSLPGGNWLKAAEDFYHSRGLPVRYHISEASPDGLDAFLEECGFLQEIPCSVLVADTEQVIDQTMCDPRDLHIHSQTSHDDKWLSNFLLMEGFTEEKRPFYHSLFTRITQQKSFFTLTLNGDCAAVGTSIAEEGWAGFTNIAVKSELRGQGIGRLLINALAQWSQRNGAVRIYLQVVNDNEPAHLLYGKAGFTPLFRFHYRVQP